MTPIAKIWVDEPVCLCNRACMVQETHVFLDTGEYFPTIADDAAKYFQSHRHQIIWSVLSCPVSAIHLQFADGTEISAPMRVEDWSNY